MWSDFDPQWRLLKSQLETKGSDWFSPAEPEERLFTNKSNRHGDDMKEALRCVLMKTLRRGRLGLLR